MTLWGSDGFVDVQLQITTQRLEADGALHSRAQQVVFIVAHSKNRYHRDSVYCDVLWSSWNPSHDIVLIMALESRFLKQNSDLWFMKASSNEPDSRGFGFLSLKRYLVSHMGTHTCNFTAWEAKTGILLGVQGQPGLKSEQDPVLKHQSSFLGFVLLLLWRLLVCLSVGILCLVFLFFFGLVSWVKVSLCSLGLLQVHDAPASVFWAPGFQVWTIMPGLAWVFCWFLNTYEQCTM